MILNVVLYIEFKIAVIMDKSKIPKQPRVQLSRKYGLISCYRHTKIEVLT